MPSLMNRKRTQSILAAVLLLAACSTQSCIAQKKNKDGFKSIFDGKTLTGWKGDPTYWRVENGSLVGEITPATLLKTNSFIVWQGGQPADFELTGEFQITEAGNSGINYRSDRTTPVRSSLCPARLPGRY